MLSQLIILIKVNITVDNCFRNDNDNPFLLYDILLKISLSLGYHVVKIPSLYVYMVGCDSNSVSGFQYIFDNNLKCSRTGHFVKVSLWYASLLINTRFRFLYFRISNC